MITMIAQMRPDKEYAQNQRRGLVIIANVRTSTGWTQSHQKISYLQSPNFDLAMAGKEQRARTVSIVRSMRGIDENFVLIGAG